MKQLLVVAIMLSTATSFAARSRMNALGNPRHIQNDSATLHTNPAYLHNVADSVTLESGSTSTNVASGSVTTGAEATLVRTMGDAKFALNLGHDDATVADLRDEANADLTQQNPLELTYGMKMGDMNVGAALGYSKYNDKKADAKEDTTLLKVGTQTATFDVAVSVSLVDKVTSGTNEYKGGSNINVVGGYWIDADLYAYGSIGMNGYKTSTGGSDTADYKSNEYEVGVIHTIKNDGSEFFYGVGLNSTKTEDSLGNKDESSEMSLPVMVGIEANAASWLTLRGAVVQTVLISDSKTEDNTGTLTEKAPGDNTTTFTAGAGLKFNKVTLDGSLLANGSQALDANNMLGTVGLTYAF